MAEPKKNYRLFRVAKELNTGSSTLVEHLLKKGYEVNDSPNEKLSEDMYFLLIKDFASEKDLKKKAEQIKEAKQDRRIRSEEPEVEEQEEIFTADELKNGILDRGRETTRPKAETAPPPVEKTKVEPPKEKLFSPKVLGKIDLSQFDRKRSGSKDKPAAEKSASSTTEVSADPVKEPVTEKKAEPVISAKPEEKTVEKSVETKTPEAKVETPKPETEAPKEEKKAVQRPLHGSPKEVEKGLPPLGKEIPAAEKPKSDEVEKSSLRKEREGVREPVVHDKPVDKGAGKDEKDSGKSEEDSVIHASDHTPKLGGLRVLGKIELPSDRRRGGKKDEKASDKPGDKSATEDDESKKRKRKRRRKRKPAAGTTEGGTTTSTGTGPNRGGTSDRKRPTVKKKEEPSEKEISEIIKSTLADLTSKKGGRKGGKDWRKRKRDTHAERREAEMDERMKQANKLEVTEFITANDLANLMNVSVTDIITKCMQLGLFVSINQRLEADVIQLLAEEYGYDVEFVDLAEKEFEEAMEVEDDDEDLLERSPIITVMGHVDHGKTSLLDYIRNANIASGEAGGITQHIGAYEVKTEDGRRICFLDTPGHEAFTAMRARGANMTDLVIIVVAADDSVMPQTKEAINHARSAGVSMIFAINKMDKAGADPDRIRQQLAEMNILLEDWGGNFQAQEISAKTGAGVDELLEKVLIEADMLELKANPDKPARGTIIEARLDKGRGVVANLLVQDGTLRVGDSLVAGIHFARVRAMMNERGERVESAGPSTPVQILGLSGTPQAGDRFMVYEDERKGKEIAQRRNELYREQSLRKNKRPTLEELARRRALGDFKELNVIVKGDVDGSVEALSDSLLRLSVDEVVVNVVHKAVGQISEADVLLATASDAIIIGFQVRPSLNARRAAEAEGVDVRLYSVIYDAINEVKDALEGLLSPDVKEEIVGSAEVRDVFHITKVGNVAGCIVQDGKMNRKDPIRLIRDGIVIYEGRLSSLKRFKDDVKEVARGYECGMQVDGYNDVKIGDVIEQYKQMEVARKLK